MKIRIVGVYDNKYRFEINSRIYFHGVDKLKEYLKSENIKIKDLEFIGLDELNEEHNRLIGLIKSKNKLRKNEK
jgi:hypothetical protein